MRAAVSACGLGGELARKRMRVGVCLLVIATLSACTSLRPIEGTDADDLLTHVKTDDRIRVTTTGGTTLNLTVTAVHANEIEGTTSSGEARTVKIADVERIDLRVRAPGKTAALVGTLVVLYAGYAFATAYGAWWGVP